MINASSTFVITKQDEEKVEGSRVESAGFECREFDVPTFALSGRRSTMSYACEHSMLAAARWRIVELNHGL